MNRQSKYEKICLSSFGVLKLHVSKFFIMCNSRPPQSKEWKLDKASSPSTWAYGLASLIKHLSY